MADISKIKLPGSEQIYNIKDAVAREAIAGGITFIVAWEGGPPTVADIPAGVKVIYQGTTYTGTLRPQDAQPGAFYLVRTSSAEYVLLTTQPSDWATNWTDYYVLDGPDYIPVSGSSAPTFAANTYYKVVNDYFDEYVAVGEYAEYRIWEKLGDTQVDLSTVVTDVALSKQTDTVIGTDATFTITQPTITLAEDSTNGNVSYVKDGVTKYMSATASGGAVTPNTVNLKATASGANTAWNSKDAVSVVTGYSSPSTDTFLKSASSETSNLVTTNIVPTNGTESVSKVTKSTSKLVTTSITGVNGTETVSHASKAASKLVTTSITPTNGTESVSNITAVNTARIIGTTVAEVASNTDVTVPNITANTQVTVPNITANSSVTANKSTWTFTMGDPTKSEDPEMLIIGGGNGSDVTATNTTLGTNRTATNTTLGSNKTASYVTTSDADVSSIYTTTSSDVGIPIVTSIDVTPKTVAKAGSAVTVATGTISSTGTGSDTLDALTISNKTVAKAGTATTVATGTISSSGTGSDTLAALTISDKTVAKAGSSVTVATGEVDPDGGGDPVVTEVTIGTTGSALTGLGSPTTKSVIGGNATFTITQPTIKLSKPSTAESGVTTTVVDGITSVTQPTIKLKAEDSTGTNREKFVYELIKSKMKGTASGAKTAWNNKDSVTVLKSTTDVNVTKGNS